MCKTYLEIAIKEKKMVSKEINLLQENSVFKTTTTNKTTTNGPQLCVMVNTHNPRCGGDQE